MLSERDLKQIHENGISTQKIEEQLTNFQNGFPFIKLLSSATKGNGIQVFTEEERTKYIEFYIKTCQDKKPVKFVPASGAASRMFKHLFEIAEKYKANERDIENFIKDKSFNSFYYFINNLKTFAFYDELKEKMKGHKLDLEECLNNKDYEIILEYLLFDKGLSYSNLPKALIKFHQYGQDSRFAFEEHLVEGADYCRDRKGNVFIHFTVSAEHKEAFINNMDRLKLKYESNFKLKFFIEYSEQKPSTDTIAVDMDNKEFREKDGSLLFRPGGHGALIENLNDIDADLIFIKNIDNIVPDSLKEPTFINKKLLGGYLLYLQEKLFNQLQKLEQNDISERELFEIKVFAANDLMLFIEDRYTNLGIAEKKAYLFKLLNRPIRVCGMVKNEGEPGGGPFWVKNQDNVVSLQIVETTQINMSDVKQEHILKTATHFNPVDLVCGVKDFKGQSFNLLEYIDPSTGFISVKSKNGKKLKAQELPGLWNGAMADWITIFVDVPISTFNPVKTINDLLRKEHLN